MLYKNITYVRSMQIFGFTIVVSKRQLKLKTYSNPPWI